MAPWLRVAMPAVFAGERLLYAAGLGMDASGEPVDGGTWVRLLASGRSRDHPRSAGFEAAAAV